MNVLDFISHLKTLDIQISADNGKLRINAPKGAVTAEIKSELSARKAEILSLLADAEPLAVTQEEGEHPISLAQEHLWQLQRLTPDTVAYNMHAVFRLRGPLHVSALEAAIRAVAERHEILRASFPKSSENRPEQSIGPVSSIVLNHLNVSPNITASDLQSVITKELRFPFDLSCGPLFRPTLVQISANEHVLILVMHHIISDGQSFAVLLRDLACAYRTVHENAKVNWDPLPLQYADYAAWQRKWLETNASAADGAYWQEQFSSEVPALELPFDRPHPLQTVADGDYVDLQLEPLRSALNDLCRREGVTLFAVTLSAFYTLLHRHSGQRDLLVCTPVAGRDRVEFSDLIGYFNNTLLLRGDLTAVQTLRQLFQRTHSNVINALAHQMFPFREVAGFPNLVRTPLSRAMVVVQNADEIAFELPGLHVEKISAFNHAMQYDLALEVTTGSGGLTGRLMYRKVLFEHGTIEMLAEDFVAILKEMLEDPDGPIARIAPPPRNVAAESSVANRPPYVAPRNDLERQLTQIWQDVLQVDRVGIHDGFFELGGHSLLALRLFTRIEQETGTKIPLSTLFGATTIAHLAQRIEGESASGAWDCLVPIQPKGAKVPFFCVHGIGGGVIGYRDISNFIGEDQPFFGLQAVGQDGQAEYDTTIEAMAARYIDVMRSQQPRGPYRIGGYCFGGVVAYEMASQLEKIGQEVSVLAIFEGAMPEETVSRVPFFTRLRAIVRNIPTWVRDYSSMSPEQLRSRVQSTVAKIQLKFRHDPEAERRARVEETLDIDINDIPQSNVQLTDIHMKAALQYAPEPILGSVTLFRARNRSINEIVFGSLDPKMGWGRLAKGGVKVLLVDGFHRNMHLAPYAESLAGALKTELDRSG